MKIKKFKEICGGSISIVLDKSLNLSLVKKIVGNDFLFENFGVLKYKLDSKEITFFEYGEILLNGFSRKEAENFSKDFIKQYQKLETKKKKL